MIPVNKLYIKSMGDVIIMYYLCKKNVRSQRGKIFKVRETKGQQTVTVIPAQAGIQKVSRCDILLDSSCSFPRT
jgi:hypothetical protein